jgi:hypothetical protein
MVERAMDFLEEIDCGHGVIITLYRDGRPDELIFTEYSFD